MRKIFSVHTTLSLVILLLLLNACRKVDEHKKLVESQPWLADTYTLNGRYGIYEWQYPSLWVVGDTAMLIGKFFTNTPGSDIRVGGVSVKVVEHVEIDPNKLYNTGGIQMETLDLVRFVVTKEMGIGQQRPVVITANGITISGAPLSIQDFAASVGRTDTTLVVDKLLHWVPANADALNKKGYAFLRTVHCDRNGAIWFDNALSINVVTGGQVNAFLSAGDKITDDKGAAFTIKHVLSSAISFDGNTLFFSIEDKEASTDTVNNYIFRLCKMEVSSRSVTTLNRTLVLNKTALLDEDAAPFQGSIDRLKTVAMYLNADLQNNLTYTNYYAPPSVAEDHSYWMSVIGGGQINMEPYGNNVALICRLDINGKVTALMGAGYMGDAKPFILTPGIHVASSLCFVDPSGKYVYGMANVDDWRTQLLKYDVQQEDVVASVRAAAAIFVLHSYDTVPATKGVGPMSISVIDWTGMTYNFNTLMVLSDGSLLAATGGSLFNYDMEQRTVYCYAGVENAFGASAPGQDKLTGKAKWVNFGGAALIGQDKTNAIYYCQGALGTDGIDFYKLHSEGK
ncbi:MAG: hypothetical protein J7623_18950 [Chitinophaga sp.]|uniref:hypothetical protein n=1 Tax=Chitinophaga sp. TaxID=1869181 RepID=UPI001B12E7C3|nr:hypothetical protein [Chitinophaga sp.]MBO9730728.1 hypothetical protein [Chitinophaga sp.]